MNEDNQYPNQNGNSNEGPNPNQFGDSNQFPNNQYGNPNQFPNPNQSVNPNQYPNQYVDPNQFPNPNQYVDPNQYQNQYQNQNQYVDPNQYQNPNQYVNQNQGQFTDQDKYWNPNQNQYQNQYQQNNQYQNQNQFQNQNQYYNQNQYGNQNQFGNTNQYGGQNPPKKPKSKKLAVTIISAIFALLLVGGGVFAFFNMQKTPKDRLLLAEANSWGKVGEAFESRYKPEFEWAKKAETTPTEYTYDIGASVDGDFYSYEEEMIAEIINNSSISLDVQLDPNNQLMKANLGADINGTQVDKISAYITSKEFMLGFPFTDDILQIKDEDFGNFMRTLDPYYEGSETLGLSDWMGKNMFSEENKDYLVKEYLLYFYDSLPAEAFKESNEEVTVFGEKLQANKISMELSGDQIRDSLVKVLEKAKNDPKFEDIILETVKNATGAAGTFEDDFDLDINEGLDSAIEELKSTDIPVGINYTAWINADTVVQSELVIGEFKVEGTRSFTTDKLKWDYTFDFEGEQLSFVGDLSSNNGQIEDEVTLLASDNTGFIYRGSEELNGGERNFNRSLSFEEEDEAFEVYWNGDSSYGNDSMEASHTIGIGTSEFAIDITWDEVGKFIKNVDIPKDNVVDIGSMSADEIQSYFEEEFLMEAQSWFMELYFQLGLF